MLTYDVAVVGGGVIGLSVAAELRRISALKVVVLERHSTPGQESSSRANGGVRAQFRSPANIQFSLYSIAEFESIEIANPQTLGFTQAGYLFLAGTSESEQRLRTDIRVQRDMGVDVSWVDPDEVLRLAPIVEASGLRGGSFSHRDGFIDPHAVIVARWRQAKDLGVDFSFDTEVQAIEVTGEHQFKIRSDSNELRTAWVVNAAGAAAGYVAQLLGVELPVIPVRRNLAVTEPVESVPDIIPMCVDVDTGILVRREGRSGFLLAYSDPKDPPSWDMTFDPTFLDAVAMRVGNRFPYLAGVPIDLRKCWAGLYPETPDHNAIIGEVPDRPGFVQCAGFGGHGIMHSPAAGRATAELIARGHCETFDLANFRYSRFSEGDIPMETAVL